MTTTTFVVAGCPIKNRLWCAERHAYSLASQSRRPDALFWLLNDDTERTGIGLCNGVLSVGGDVPVGTIEHFDTGDAGYSRIAVNGTPRYSISNLAVVRNKWVERALALWPQLTHLWSVDSDVVPDDDVLAKLLDADLPVVAAVVQNSTHPGVVNFWCDTAYNNDKRPKRSGHAFHERMTTLKDTPQYVTMTGACVLVRRDVLDSGVSYDYDHDGEDVAWSMNAQRCGFMLAVHPLARTTHLQPDGEEWR